jgi:uncharacterized protein
MKERSDATLLRIFVGYDDVYEDKPLYEQLVLKARAMEMAGATVTRGILAYGPASKELGIILRLSEDAPILVEIVDSDEKIKSFLAAANPMIESGLVTTQKVSVLRYGRKPA